MKASRKTALLGAFAAPCVFALAPVLANDPGASVDHGAHGSAHHASTWIRSPLVAKVRAATRRYKDVNVAIAEGWVAATPCVSGPNEGAMGVHYVLPERVGDAVLRADQPEALIYQPLPGGRLRLVGVEFIVLAEPWETQHAEAQPALEGHLLNLVGAPNRYRLPAFYELHVWAWERNPNGAFADWNTVVSCDAQPLD
ncbi:MAG: hypothetical protein ACREV5_05880 [Steroidobacter sp.]